MTTARKPRSHASALDEPFALALSHRRMLQALYRYRYLTAPLLGLVYGAESGTGRGLKHVRNELGRLFHHGYVVRHSAPPSGHGSEQFVYTLTKRGAQAILDDEEYAVVRHQVYNREAPQRHYAHHVAISTLQVLLELGGAPWSVESFSSDHEDPKRTQVRVALPSGSSATVWPDASVVIRFPNEQQALYLFEIERTRKQNPRTDDRFRAYAAHLAAGLERIKERHRVNNAVAVFVVPTEEDLRRLSARALEVLRAEAPQPRPMFLFWNMESWYSEETVQRTRNGRADVAVVRGLRPPAEVLAEENVTNIAGKPRRLVQG